ncbi:hypothetical protein [Streptomyces sp. GS7]|uniref:hypothetical protein n=1 Tax=Streptomyces sp. GS7 TaxID=2692234 RepID=UPI0013199A5C|nr:hypothetical protein [Streptomyces sp. GS7]QHC23456.1 hypothetical protein GR130_20780 [Streptomyces sp. GS7]
MEVDDLHCTLLHAVGLSNVDKAAVGAPCVLTYDRPAVGNVAVEISGWPSHPFKEIVETLTQVMERRFGPFKSAQSRYPHISLAYTTSGAEDIDATDLKAALAAIGQPLSGTVLMDRLHLVEQWHDGARITWTPIAEVALTGEVPA